MHKLLIALFAVTLAACGQQPVPTGPDADAAAPAAEMPAQAAPTPSERLAAVLADQPEDVQARYRYRHPQQTLEFFGITPGMTVMEALPGGGWYSKILLDYLGEDGQLIGADYAPDMFPLFGFFSDEQLEAKKTWVADWTAQAEGWRDDDDAGVAAFQFGALPEPMVGTADAVLFIRALHNLQRFEGDGGYLTAALEDAYRVLRSGGIAGVVQHHARPDMPDEWADGSRGYLKQNALIAAMEQAGFEYVADSDINANPADQPTADDVVWRLPPTLATSREDPALRAELEAVGESNRMTLLFRKP
jgi:predicted methyltransferase